jgi:HK97 family phage prohead protease
LTISRFIVSAFEIKSVNDAGAIEGFASIYHDRDSHGDHVQPGAFRKSVADFTGAGKPMVMLWQHQADKPIGVWSHFKDEPKGLRVTGQLALKTQAGAEARELVKMGAVNGLSIGFSDAARRARKDGGFDLIEAKLWETSIVTFPSNTTARVTSLKRSADDLKNPRVLESLLCDAGYSGRESKHPWSSGSCSRSVAFTDCYSFVMRLSAIVSSGTHSGLKSSSFMRRRFGNFEIRVHSIPRSGRISVFREPQLQRNEIDSGARSPRRK